jgi:hypothetical protein
MKKKHSKEEWAARLIVNLYEGQYLQTIFNAEKEVNQRKGWRLKDASWAPWFFNMRPVGSSPHVFYNICLAMAEMIAEHNVDQLIGVEMAGIPFAGGINVALKAHHGINQPIGYTRPLPQKVRRPTEAAELLKKMGDDVAGYGQKDFVEARLYNGMSIGILDDMANDLGSKIIARLQVLWQARQRNVAVKCNKIFYFLNRNKGNCEKGIAFANEKDEGLYPEELDVNYIIEFDDYLPELKNVMESEEYQLIIDFQKDRAHFQDENVQREVLAMVP